MKPNELENAMTKINAAALFGAVFASINTFSFALATSPLTILAA